MIRRFSGVGRFKTIAVVISNPSELLLLTSPGHRMDVHFPENWNVFGWNAVLEFCVSSYSWILRSITNAITRQNSFWSANSPSDR